MNRERFTQNNTFCNNSQNVAQMVDSEEKHGNYIDLYFLVCKLFCRKQRKQFFFLLFYSGPASAVSAVNNIPSSPAVNHADSLSEASPRKRARKQLL